jgi:hypothetical protein
MVWDYDEDLSQNVDIELFLGKVFPVKELSLNQGWENP